MEENIAIRVNHLAKLYKIYNQPIDRLKESLNPFGRRYSRDFHALTDISFAVEKGETVGVIGENGAGKSTLLKIITGVLTPTAGEIQVNGRIASLLELGAGFNPDMNGMENIYMSGTIIGCSREEMDKKVPNIIAFADIGDFIDQPVKMYSSGMFARLAFAVNAFIEPDILIVDEALSVGDAAFQAKCITRMRQMMKQGVTILFVTHDMATISSFCKKCVYLEKGKIREIGETKKIVDIYLKDLRKKMNADYQELLEKRFADPIMKGLLSDKSAVSCPVESSVEKVDFDEASFDERVKMFRQGTGMVKFIKCEMLDEQGKALKAVAFDQKVKLRFFIRFLANIAINIGYKIRDEKGIELLGSNIAIEGQSLIHGCKNEIFAVEFNTRLPLVEGDYSLTLVCTQPVIADKTAVFADYIDNVEVFKVKMRDEYKLWHKVYVENSLCIKKIKN